MTTNKTGGTRANGRESVHQRAAKMALSSEAAEWFVRLRDDRLGVRHRERTVRWLKRSPAHIAELLRIQQVYKALRAAKLQNPPPGSFGPGPNIIELVPRAMFPPHGAVFATESRLRFQSWKIAATMACIAVSLLLGVMVKASWLDPTVEAEPVARQHVDADYERALADGWMSFRDRATAEIASESDCPEAKPAGEDRVSDAARDSADHGGT